MPAVQVLQVLSQVENDAITTAFLHEQILSFQDFTWSNQCQQNYHEQLFHNSCKSTLNKWINQCQSTLKQNLQ